MLSTIIEIVQYRLPFSVTFKSLCLVMCDVGDRPHII